jgi:predicted DNA-binding protein (UPF0251 family)
MSSVVDGHAASRTLQWWGPNCIVGVMPARRTESPTSDDLFSAAAKKQDPAEMVAPQMPVSRDPSSSPPRYLLPKDLSGALARLDSREIDSLLAALIDEAMRRGRLTPTLTAKLLKATRGADEVPKARTVRPARPSRPQGANGDGAASLTVGQTNAVRAAFMAGIKPSTIARQFGVSQSAVRKALASDARLRKP